MTEVLFHQTQQQIDRLTKEMKQYTSLMAAAAVELILSSSLKIFPASVPLLFVFSSSVLLSFGVSSSLSSSHEKNLKLSTTHACM